MRGSGVRALLVLLALLSVGAGLTWLMRGAGAPWAATSARCAPGLVALGPRCCGEGQRLDGDRCVGAPSRCPPWMESRPEGCVLPAQVLEVRGGRLREAPSDWEAEGVVQGREIEVPSFALDSSEVSEEAYARCARAEACVALEDSGEPGRPRTRLNLSEAQAFCRWVGGRLPTSAELAWAAAGPRESRYPWGPHGAVCRRAAFGLVAGPCGQGALGPDLRGSRPDGRSPEGFWDLSGNAAEWTQPSAGVGARWAEVRGGSFADAEAGALKTWHRRERDTRDRSVEIGFRCAYDR